MLTSVGVWAMYNDYRSEEARRASVALLERARVDHCSIMVNDFSTAREPTPFTTRPLSTIIAFARDLAAAGIAVSLTSWIMPHTTFVSQAAAVLPQLVLDTGASLLIWDAEEPWTRAKLARYNAAVDVVKGRDWCAPLGLTAIGTANPSEVGELASACGVWLPQAYASDDGESTPERVVEYSLDQWEGHYGVPQLGWRVGLAAYRQEHPTTTMQPPIDDVLARGLSQVCYWSLSQLRDPDVLAFVAGLKQAPPVSEPSGIFHTVDLTVGGYSKRVAMVQGLLAAQGFDPGTIDGKPGPNTRAAWAGWCTSVGLSSSPVVTAAAWSALLSG